MSFILSGAATLTLQHRTSPAVMRFIRFDEICLIYELIPFPERLSPGGLVTEVLWTLCDTTECAEECLQQTPVIETLLAPVVALLSGHQVKHSEPKSYIHIHH